MKKKLTVRGINALKPAESGKRYDLWDTEVPNFGARVTDTGKISFIVMRRIGPDCIDRYLAPWAQELRRAPAWPSTRGASVVLLRVRLARVKNKELSGFSAGCGVTQN